MTWGLERATVDRLCQVFGDIVTMMDGDCRLYCERAGCVVIVPPCEILVAGYPCTSLSGLNVSPRGFSDPSSSTGGPQQAIMQYCMQKKPQVLIFENVKQMVQVRKVDRGEDRHVSFPGTPAHTHTMAHAVYMPSLPHNCLARTPQSDSNTIF